MPEEYADVEVFGNGHAIIISALNAVDAVWHGDNDNAAAFCIDRWLKADYRAFKNIFAVIMFERDAHRLVDIDIDGMMFFFLRDVQLQIRIGCVQQGNLCHVPFAA